MYPLTAYERSPSLERGVFPQLAFAAPPALGGRYLHVSHTPKYQWRLPK
jgi:hypothetical protein